MAAEPLLGALDPSWGPPHINPEGPWLIEGPNIKWILWVRCFQFLLESWNQMILFLQTFWKGCWTPTWFTRCCGGVYGLNENLTCLKPHPWKLTWNQKITQLKRKIIFQTSIIVVHVNFPGRKTVFILLGELFLPEISIVVVNLITTCEFPVPWKVLQKDDSQRILF